MPELRIGSTVVYDGDRCEIVEILGDAVVLADSRSQAHRVRIVDLLRSVDDGGLTQLPRDSGDPEDGPPTVLHSVLWKTATKAARAQALARAADVREVLTGYRSGESTMPEAGEPRAAYDPATTTLGQRQKSKADEQRVSRRTIQLWAARYLKFGEPGLLDGRSSSSGSLLARLDPRWLDTCTEVLAEQEDQGTVQKDIILGWIDARVRQREIRGDYGDQPVRRPSRSTAHLALRELDRGRALFTLSTKTKRSVAGRPEAPYGRRFALRPGEYFLLDTTEMNVFGRDAMTGRWDSVELTTAMDLADRVITGLRLSPRSSKSIDVASVLLEAMTPFERPAEWSTDAVRPYSGIPTTIGVNVSSIRVARFPPSLSLGVPGSDGLVPDAIVVDHGRVYMSEHITNVCARLGISIQPARVAMGSDKGHMERFYGTIESLLQELPGYKGRSVDTRGRHPEKAVVYTIQQLEMIVREWIATVYHHQPHSELYDPRLPNVMMTPAEAHARGIATAGRLRVPRNRELLLEMLPVEMRHFNHYGVEIKGLTYTGPVVAKYQNRSRLVRKGDRDWPFHYNPDDMTQIYFYDPDVKAWETLRWTRVEELNAPFSLDALEYAKSIAKSRGGRPDVEAALVELLRKIGISRGDTPREKLIAARAAAQRDDGRMGLSQPTSMSIVPRLLSSQFPAGIPPQQTVAEDHTGGDDDNDDDAAEDFYDDILADL